MNLGSRVLKKEKRNLTEVLTQNTSAMQQGIPTFVEATELAGLLGPRGNWP